MDNQFNFYTDSTHSYWRNGLTDGPATLMPYAVFHGPSGIRTEELNEVHFDPTYEAQTLKRFIVKTSPLEESSYYSTAGGDLSSTFLLNLDTVQLYTAYPDALNSGHTNSYGSIYQAKATSCSEFQKFRDDDNYPVPSGVNDVPVPVRGLPIQFRKIYFEGMDANIPSNPPEWAYSETYGKWSIYASTGTVVSYENKVWRSTEKDNQGITPGAGSAWEEVKNNGTKRYFAYFLCGNPIRNDICAEGAYNPRDANEQWELGENASWENFDIASAPVGGGGGSGCDSAFTNITANQGAYTASGCDALSVSGRGGINTIITKEYVGPPGSGSYVANLYIDFTGTASGGGSGCSSAIVQISGNAEYGETPETYTASGCDSSFGILGAGNIHTTIQGNAIYISQTGAFTGAGGSCTSAITKISGDTEYGETPETYTASGCDSSFGILGEGNIHTRIEGGSLYISQTGSFTGAGGGAGSGCPSAISQISGDIEVGKTPEIYTATGCHSSFGILGEGNIHTRIDGGSVYISQTGFFTGNSFTGCFEPGTPIRGNWNPDPLVCPESGPDYYGEATLRVVPRTVGTCTFFDLSGSAQDLLSGMGYEEKYVGLCNDDGTTTSGWVLFKPCRTV